MKKVLLLSMGICFLFSVTAISGVMDSKVEKVKTEKVSDSFLSVETFEKVTPVKIHPVNESTVFVDNKETSGFNYLQKESFTSHRFWHRNQLNPNTNYKEDCKEKTNEPIPDKNRTS